MFKGKKKKKVEPRLKGPQVQFNPDGTVKRPLFTFLRLMFSDDNLMPSSSRVIGTWIFAFVTLAVGFITWILGLKIQATQDHLIVEACMQGIKTLLWIYTTMLASALSMYGIHVWKYMAQIQSGLFLPQFPMGQQYGSQYGQSPYGSMGTMGSTLSQIRPTTPVSVTTPGKSTPVQDHEEREATPPKTKTPAAGVGSDD